MLPYFLILIVSTYYILCISWIINCIIIIDERCSHEDNYWKVSVHIFFSKAYLDLPFLIRRCVYKRFLELCSADPFGSEATLKFTYFLIKEIMFR